LRQADHLSKEVLPSVLIRLQNLRCEAAKVLKKTVEPLMMMIHNLNHANFHESRYNRSSHIIMKLEKLYGVCLYLFYSTCFTDIRGSRMIMTHEKKANKVDARMRIMQMIACFDHHKNFDR
jgi:ppGpp synthetase/RelA/SpoT-type nucleotidyltranferase